MSGASISSVPLDFDKKMRRNTMDETSNQGYIKVPTWMNAQTCYAKTPSLLWRDLLQSLPTWIPLPRMSDILYCDNISIDIHVHECIVHMLTPIRYIYIYINTYFYRLCITSSSQTTPVFRAVSLFNTGQVSGADPSPPTQL